MLKKRNKQEQQRVQNFELPRPDWHDDEGRINKTALIENFNAIEAKLNELNSLKGYDVIVPDFNDIEIPDTTINSPDNSIINVKSLVDILNLKCFPIVLEFNGKKIIEVSYYNNNYEYKTIKDTVLEDWSDDKPWLFLDCVNNTIYCTNDYSNPNGHTLLALYNRDKVFTLNGTGLIDINILEPLSKMTRKTFTFTTGTTYPIAIMSENRLYGYMGKESRASSIWVTTQDQGF